MLLKFYPSCSINTKHFKVSVSTMKYAFLSDLPCISFHLNSQLCFCSILCATLLCERTLCDDAFNRFASASLRKKTLQNTLNEEVLSAWGDSTCMWKGNRNPLGTPRFFGKKKLKNP